MIKIITIGLFCVFSLLVFGLAAFLKMKGRGAMGKPSLTLYSFIIGKLSLFSCFGVYIYALLEKDYVNPIFSDRMEYFSFGIFLFGMFITLVGLVNLGMALRMGLPQEETELKTTGIYRLSRNPIYVGFNLICLASVLYYPVIINVALLLIVYIYHHFVIRAEEGFLEKRFGNSWKDYVKKTEGTYNPK